MDKRVVESPGATLTVYAGGGTGKPILLLHGGPGVPDYMRSTTALLPAGFRAVSFDQRGVGESACADGRYDVNAYLGDIEAVRTDCGVRSWHVLGHSWGGLLAQAYAARYPWLVESLVLVSSSLGVGADWTAGKRESFRIGLRRAGALGAARFFGYGSGLPAPGSLGRWAMRHVMTETWHNYFLDPGSAPDPDPLWLAGCSAAAMIRTDRALKREDPAILFGLNDFRGPAMILYGEYDIYGESAQDTVRRRLPQASQVTLASSGHVHWLQNPQGYRDALDSFYRDL